MSLIYVEGFDDNVGANMNGVKGWQAFTNPTVSGGRWSTYSSPGYPATYAMSKQFTNTDTTIIVGWATRCTGSNPTTTDDILDLYGDTGTTQHITLTVTAAREIQVRRGGLAGTILGTTATGVWPQASDGWVYFELKVDIDDSAGTVDLVKNESNVLSLTSQDTRNGGTVIAIDRVRWWGPTGPSLTYFDDIYVANGAGSVNNDFLGDVHVATVFPAADGTVNDWAPSTGIDNYALVDDNPANTSDYVEGSVTGDIDMYDFAATSGGSPKGVQVNSYAQKTEAGPRSLRHRINSDSNIATSSDTSLGASWTYQSAMFETDPDGGGAWTIGQINAAEFGVEARP